MTAKRDFLWGLSLKSVPGDTIDIVPIGVSEASRIANPVAIESCSSESLSRVASGRKPSDAHLVIASGCSTIGHSSQREQITDTRADAEREFWQAWLSHRIFGEPSAESRLLLLSDEEPAAATPPNQQSSVAYHLLGDQGEPVARNVGSGTRVRVCCTAASFKSASRQVSVWRVVDSRSVALFELPA